MKRELPRQNERGLPRPVVIAGVPAHLPKPEPVIEGARSLIGFPNLQEHHANALGGQPDDGLLHQPARDAATPLLRVNREVEDLALCTVPVREDARM